MDMKALAEAACMFSTAAYETTYGNWVFDPDEYDDTIDPDELEDALWQVGGYYLLEVERYDGRFDLTVSTYYTKDEEYDGPFDDETEKAWLDAWDTAAACTLFGSAAGWDNGRWVKQERLIADSVLGEYIPCNDAVLAKAEELFGDLVKFATHDNLYLYMRVKEEA